MPNPILLPTRILIERPSPLILEAHGNSITHSRPTDIASPNLILTMRKQVINEQIRTFGDTDVEIGELLIAESQGLVGAVVCGDEDGLALRFALAVGVGGCLAEVGDRFRDAAGGGRPDGGIGAWIDYVAGGCEGGVGEGAAGGHVVRDEDPVAVEVDRLLVKLNGSI